MTCIDYLRSHNVSEEMIDNHIEEFCPSDFLDIDNPKNCCADVPTYITCRQCWEREFVEKEKEEKTMSTVTVTLNKADEDRLDRLCKRVDKSRSEVVSVALKFYEDALDITDKVRSRYSAISFEVDSNETH